MTEQDIEFMKLSIKEARESKSEDGRIHPKVGVVIVKDGKILAKAFRGELAPGEHAEYTALEKKLKDESLAGSTVYTTLEPCTTRNHPKIPCAQRLIERKIKHIYIGTLDPNSVIRGRGQLAMRSANITTEFYPDELMKEIEELNRDFNRDQAEIGERIVFDENFISENRKRSLDDWYQKLNSIYWNRNFYRETSDIFVHLVEVIGGLSLLASSKKKKEVDPENYVSKCLAWWFALCGKIGVRSVEEMLWDKFPNVCAYCQKDVHDPDECSEKKANNPGPQWEELNEIGKGKDKPSSIGEWQQMFSKIYPAQQTEEYGPSFARLGEELGELAEAVRIFKTEPGYFLSEACDVFAWLMHIQNIIEHKQGIPKKKRGDSIEIEFCKSYPDFCRDCGKKKCSCPPILPNTIGRIAHEVPKTKGSFESLGRFMTPDKTSKKFGF